MSNLQVTLFGRFRVEHDGEPVAGLESRKTQELLAYLFVNQGRPLPREALADMLWGERAGQQARKYLRQALWQAQSALDACMPTGCEAFFHVDQEWVQIDPCQGVHLDFARFSHAHELAQGVAGQKLDDNLAEEMSSAVQLYQGDLLEGCYQDWCLFERERLQNMYLGMLDKLIDWCQVHQEYEVGLGYGEQILRYDRARERTHRRMMRLYYLGGDRTSALRQYQQLVRTLREELDVKPSRLSVQLWEQIRADTYSDAPPGGGVSSALGGWQAGAGLADPRAQLRRLHSVLTAMQRQIRQEIDAVELALAE